jgi:hypothetical protein
MLHLRLTLSALLCATLIVACSKAPARPHASLSPDIEPLRSEFNRDVGRVRILMIGAPT